jgi:addiction module RelE/StbE family toxin
LLAIVDYISDDNPGAAQRLKDEIDAKVSRLPDNPLIHRLGRVAGTREMVVRPNYLVVYSVNDHTVAILPLLHAARQWPPNNGPRGRRV